MLWSPYTRPERDEAMEGRVRAELQQIDSLLDIQWVDSIFFNARQQSFEGRYALACHFPADDPRRRLFQTGEIGSDYEILGWFAEDMQDASVPVAPEQIWNRVLALLNSADNTKVPWKQRLASAAAHNKQLREKNRSNFLENEVHDIASYERERALGNRIVNVSRDI